MDAEPWDLHFYSDRKTVHIPYDSVERILLVMQTYGVTHITYNGQESLKPLYDNQIEGFEFSQEVHSLDHGLLYEQLVLERPIHQPLLYRDPAYL